MARFVLLQLCDEKRPPFGGRLWPLPVLRLFGEILLNMIVVRPLPPKEGALLWSSPDAIRADPQRPVVDQVGVEKLKSLPEGKLIERPLYPLCLGGDPRDREPEERPLWGLGLARDLEHGGGGSGGGVCCEDLR